MKKRIKDLEKAFKCYFENGTGLFGNWLVTPNTLEFRVVHENFSYFENAEHIYLYESGRRELSVTSVIVLAKQNGITYGRINPFVNGRYSFGDFLIPWGKNRHTVSDHILKLFNKYNIRGEFPTTLLESFKGWAQK